MLCTWCAHNVPMLPRLAYTIAMIAGLLVVTACLTSLPSETYFRARRLHSVQTLVLQSTKQVCTGCCMGDYRASSIYGDDVAPPCCEIELPRILVSGIDPDFMCPREAPYCRGYMPVSLHSDRKLGNCYEPNREEKAELELCDQCPVECCKREFYIQKLAEDLGDCSTAGRFCATCSAPVDTRKSYPSHKNYSLYDCSSDYCNASGAFDCSNCRCDCHLRSSGNTAGSLGSTNVSVNSSHAGGLGECVGSCNPIGIHIHPNDNITEVLEARQCKWSRSVAQCNGKGMGVVIPRLTQFGEHMYMGMTHVCFCDEGFRGSGCQIQADVAFKLAKCMSKAKKKTILFVGDSMARKRYVAMNRLFNNHRGELSQVVQNLSSESYVEANDGNETYSLHIRLEWSGNSSHYLPSEQTPSTMHTTNPDEIVTLFNMHLWEAGVNKSVYCRDVEQYRTRLDRQTYGHRIFLGIYPIDFSRVDEFRKTHWAGNDVFKSEIECTTDLLDGYIPMWDTIKNLATDLHGDGYHITTYMADVQVARIVDQVCDQLKIPV